MAGKTKALEKKTSSVSDIPNFLHQVSEIDLDDAKANFVKNTGVALTEICVKYAAELQAELNELKAQKRKDEEERLASLQERLDFDKSLIENNADFTPEQKARVWDDYVGISNKMDAIRAARDKRSDEEIQQKATTRNVAISSSIIGGSVIVGSIAYSLIKALMKKH